MGEQRGGVEKQRKGSCSRCVEDSDAMLRGWNFTLWVVGDHWDFGMPVMCFRKLPVKCRGIRDGKCWRQPEYFSESCGCQMSVILPIQETIGSTFLESNLPHGSCAKKFHTF